MMRRAWMAPAKNQRFWLSSESLCAMRAEEREPDFFERDARGAGEAPRRGERRVERCVRASLMARKRIYATLGMKRAMDQRKTRLSCFLSFGCILKGAP